MTPDIPEKWLRRMTSPLASLAAILTPAGLTFGVPAFARPLITDLLSANQSMTVRVYACGQLVLLAVVTLMAVVGFAVCVRFQKFTAIQKKANKARHSNPH